MFVLQQVTNNALVFHFEKPFFNVFQKSKPGTIFALLQ
jgi:hypothetical protein